MGVRVRNALGATFASCYRAEAMLYPDNRTYCCIAKTELLG